MTTLGPHPIPHSTTVSCVICQSPVSLQHVTAGSLYADGRQAFACSSHLPERARWIISWAVFDYQQRELREIESLAESLA